MNGTIHLNFVGKNVVYTPAGNKPGLVKIFSADMGTIKPKLERQIKMVHSSLCTDNTFEMRIEATTQPWLGKNMYAEDREQPRIPWRPNDESAALEEPK